MSDPWNYAVTFESESQQPETVRGVATGSLSAAVSRAVRQAKRQKPTRNRYRSIVVLIERGDTSIEAPGDVLHDNARKLEVLGFETHDLPTRNRDHGRAVEGRQSESGAQAGRPRARS